MTTFVALTASVLLGVWILETLLFVLSYKLAARPKETLGPGS